VRNVDADAVRERAAGFAASLFHHLGNHIKGANRSAEYDNSMENQFVVNALKQQGLSAPRDVYMGETTLDEMCLGAFGIATKIDPTAP
jgi:hypothetical protein